jgi:hypothetical protein
MVHKKGNRRALITAIAILVVLLVAIGTITIIRAVNSGKDDPYVQPDPSTSSTETTNETPSDTTEPVTGEDGDTPTSNEEEPTLDPATVGTIEITPMEIVVSYVKGAGGFEYEVLRTANGTRYVEFRNESLAGTKCTNDKGAFASILAEPTSNESATLSKTTTVDGATYGLSLEGTTCTSDVDALKAYQKSFSDAFSLLKKTD